MPEVQTTAGDVLGFNTVVLVESFWSDLARLLRIETSGSLVDLFYLHAYYPVACCRG